VMSMRAIEAILFGNTERIAVATVCLLGAGFMILFFIALFLQGKRTCPRSLIPGGRSAIRVQRISIPRTINRKSVGQRQLDKMRHYEWF
jgi:hypothetical protein